MPTLPELDAAMAQPAHFVPALRQLGSGVVRLDQAGQPIREQGRDAVVYELRTPTGRILALRVFLSDDANRDTTVKYDITAIPTILVFKNGVPVKKFVGFQKPEALIAALSE